MCGAYSLFADSKKLKKRFKAKGTKADIPQRYNIRPTQSVAVILNTDPEEIVMANWGVIPFWDKTGKKSIINARKDSLEKPTFKKSFHEGRCLILADGFYEWKATENGKIKIPYRFELKSREPFAFAGICGGESPHCAIITTEPNKTVGVVHDRMPAILKPEDEAQWLNPDLDPDQAIALLAPYDDKDMAVYQVSRLLNSPQNDWIELTKPINIT